MLPGLGTPLLPITRVVPKELLKVWGKPTIQWILEEAFLGGIEEVAIFMIELIVLGSGTDIPARRRGSPALVLRGMGQEILIDIGLACRQYYRGEVIVAEDMMQIFI